MKAGGRVAIVRVLAANVQAARESARLLLLCHAARVSSRLQLPQDPHSSFHSPTMTGCCDDSGCDSEARREEQAGATLSTDHTHEEKVSDPGCCEGSNCGCDGGSILAFSRLTSLDARSRYMHRPACSSHLCGRRDSPSWPRGQSWRIGRR